MTDATLSADTRAPAFPTERILRNSYGDISDRRIDEGLTKRELFAAMAMQGILSHGTEGNRFDVAHDAIAAADALLEVLSK